MKKTIPTTLSGRLFYVEEDAYERLSRYLDSVKAHFASYADSAEIISDIENRIAEQFIEKTSKNNTATLIVTLAHVEALIASMGNVEDFSADEEQKEDTGRTASHTGSMKKKLFRDPDDVIIAGVASGLAAYFGVDPTVVRLLFVLVVFFGGSGILVYVILWLILPEAKTATDRLQMRGEKITLESVQELAKEKINEVKTHSRFTIIVRKILTLPFIIIGKILRIFFPLMRKLVGLAVTLSASVVAFLVFFVLIITVFNVQSPYVDFPLMQIGHHFLIYILMFAIFFAIFVPAVFVLLLGIKLMSKAKVFHKAAVFSMLGVWCLSVFFAGAIGVRLAPEYQNFMMTSPAYQETTRDFPLADFTGIRVTDGNKVTLSQTAKDAVKNTGKETLGDAFKVSAIGVSQDLDRLSFKIENGILVIDSTEHFKICIFCGGKTPEITITMPLVNNISLSNGSRLSASASITSDDLSLSLENGSRVTLPLIVKNLKLDEENASHATLTGKAATADISLSNASSTNASGLEITDATITAENGSTASVNAKTSIKADLSNGSIVIYEGTPKIEKKTSNGSTLRHK